MLFVGLTEKHRESAKMFVNVVGPQVISQIASDSSMEGLSKIKSVTEQNSLLSDSELDSNYHQDGTSDQKTTENVSTENLEGIKKNMTVEKIMEEYKACISPLRNSQSVRRTNSLREISPANFSKEARLLVPEAVLQQIRSLNSLDLRLFKYAEGIYAKQNERMHELVTTEELKSVSSDSHGIRLWQATVLATCFAFFILLCVNARRRRSKLKI